MDVINYVLSYMCFSYHLSMQTPFIYQGVVTGGLDHLWKWHEDSIASVLPHLRSPHLSFSWDLMLKQVL